MKYKPPRPKSAEFPLTPMIDVIFLLLVFFVCTSNFNPLENILPLDTTLPGSVAAEVVLPDPVDLDVVLIKISFAGKPHWQIEGNQCSSLHEVRGVLQAIRAVKQDVPVLIESADNVPMETVIDVYDLCRRVGLLQIQFAALL